MKMGPDALGTVENESGSAKYDNGSWGVDAIGTVENASGRPPTAEKVSGRAKHENIFAVGTAENEFGRAKHENRRRRHRYRQKRVRERKT
jgi:hypothetical protein